MIDIREYILKSREERQAHLRLDEPCVMRGGNSTQHRGILVEFLSTTFPRDNKVNLCHACNNGECSNPKHLYWGTVAENVEDAIRNGRKTTKGRSPWNKGKKFSVEHREKLSLVKKGQPSNNKRGKNQYSPE